MRRLFWVLTVNGVVLAVEGLMQRAEGGNKLLWLIVPRYEQDAEAQFGPYAYRANAAQYFNLLWPAVLGFWWAGVSSLRRHKSAENRRATKPACRPAAVRSHHGHLPARFHQPRRGHRADRQSDHGRRNPLDGAMAEGIGRRRP